MKWKHGKDDSPEARDKRNKEYYDKNYVRIQTCCECEVFVYASSGHWDDKPYLTIIYRKICDQHKDLAAKKFCECVRDKI